MSRIALDFGFIQIYWYSIMIAIGLAVGTGIMLKEAKRQNIAEDDMTSLILYGVIFAIAGARIYYVLFNLAYYSKNIIEIFEIWNGGLAIHGAMISGGIYTYIYCHRKNLNFIKVVDIIVVGLIIGQAIGRWGNFFNQEAYGAMVSLKYLKSLHLPEFIITGMKIGDFYYHPTFLYESICDLIGFIILVFVRRFRYIKVGQITSLYMIWYGFTRFIIEGLREDSLMFLGIRIAQLVSVTMVIIGFVYFVYKYKQSRMDDLYNIDSK